MYKLYMVALILLLSVCISCGEGDSSDTQSDTTNTSVASYETNVHKTPVQPYIVEKYDLGNLNTLIDEGATDGVNERFWASGDYVVWMDLTQDQGYKLFAYDLLNGEKFEIPFELGSHYAYKTDYCVDVNNEIVVCIENLTEEYSEIH